MEILIDNILKNHFDGTYLSSLTPTLIFDLYQFIAMLNYPDYFNAREATVIPVKLKLMPGFREEIRTHIFTLEFEQEMLLNERVLESKKLVYFIDKQGNIVSNQVEVVASARKESENMFKVRFELLTSKIKDANEIDMVILEYSTQIKEMTKAFKLQLAIKDDLI
jgi:hypothetical protein